MSEILRIVIETDLSNDAISIFSEWKDPEKTMEIMDDALQQWVRRKVPIRCKNCKKVVGKEDKYCRLCGTETGA